MPNNPRKIKKLQGLLLVLISFQVALLLERLIFDSLGKIYVLILTTCLTLLANIIVVFGVYKLNTKFIKFFIIWSFLWIVLNVVVVFTYLRVGSLSHEYKWLSFKKKSQSWFAINGFGCNSTKSIEVDSCVIKFEYIEAAQSILHVLIAAVNMCLSLWLIKKLEEEPTEDRDHFINSSFRILENKQSRPIPRKKEFANRWI